MKRIIQKIYEIFQTHDSNNRLFADKLMQASMFCRAMQKVDFGEKPDYDHLKKLFRAHDIYWTVPINLTSLNIKKSDFKEVKEYNRQKLQFFKQARVYPGTILKGFLDKEIEIINKFLLIAKDVEIEEEMPTIMSNVHGVIGVLSSPLFTYEKGIRRGLI